MLHQQATMKFSLLLLLPLLAWTTASPVKDTTVDGALEYTDRRCGSTYGNLWLDIVFVVDNSVGMGRSQLGSISADIETVMTGASIGITSTNPRTSRVGIVTYNAVATTVSCQEPSQCHFQFQVADLNTFKSTKDFTDKISSYAPTISNVETSYLSSGLEQAEKIFEDGYTIDRDVVRKVIVVYASTYE